MAPGSANGGSKPREMIPIIRHPLYKCSWCSKTFKNPQARGGHMTKHRQELIEMRRQNEEYMANKRSKINMELLPPNKEYWRRYHEGQEKPDEFVFIPVKENGASLVEIELSRDLSLSQSNEAKVVGIEDQGKELGINRDDLTLKL